MNIAILSPNPLCSLGGGTKSLARLCAELSFHHQVTVFTTAIGLPFEVSHPHHIGFVLLDFDQLFNRETEVLNQFINELHGKEIIYLSDKNSLMFVFSLNIKAIYPDLNIVFKETSEGKLLGAWEKLPAERQLQLTVQLDGIVCISSAIYQHFSQSQVFNRPGIHLAYIPNGVDTRCFYPLALEEKYRLRQLHKIPLGLPIFIFTGRFCDKKNLDIIFGAWFEMEKRYGQFGYLILIGEAHKSYDHLIMALFTRHLKNLSIIPAITHDALLAEWYQLSDYFISPSSREGLSNAFLEASSCGLYPIVSNASGYQDVIKSSSEGYIVEQRNTSHLIQCLEIIIENIDDYRARGKENANIIKRSFNIEEVANQMVKFFQRIKCV